MKTYLGGAHYILGEIDLKSDPTQALARFDQAIVLFQEIKAQNSLANVYGGVGRLHKQQGRTAQAREYLTRALEIFARQGTLLEPDKMREELAGLPAGR